MKRLLSIGFTLFVSNFAFAATVTGRVLSTQGQPVVGAIVKIEIVIPLEGELETLHKEARTDVNGQFSSKTQAAIESASVKSVHAAGFVQRSAPQAEEKNGAFQFPDTLMAALTRRLTGRVLNAQGAPAVGALVAAPEAASSKPVITDGQGRYVLENLPVDESPVLAAHGKDFARRTTQSHSVDLTLLPPRKLESLAQVQPKPPYEMPYWAVESYWEALGTPAMLALALQNDGALPLGEMNLAQADWAKAGKNTLTFLGRAEWNDSPWLRSQGPGVLAKMPSYEQNPRLNDKHPRLWVEASIAAAQSLGDENERAAAHHWLEKALAEAATGVTPNDKPDRHLRNAARWFRMAGIAGALGDIRTKEFVGNAVHLVEKSATKNIHNLGSGWGPYLGYGGPQNFDLLPTNWDLADRAWMLMHAVRRLARVDLSRARLLHEKLKAMETGPAFEVYRLKHRGKADGGEAEERSPWSSQTQSMLIKARALHDPVGALQEAEATLLANEDLLVIAHSAWRHNESEVAESALRLVLSQEPNHGYLRAGQYAYAAVLAQKIDAQLARSLWLLAQERLDETKAERSEDYFKSVAEMAFYLAPFAPAEQRLRLETVWHNENVKQKFENTYFGMAVNDFSSAMITLDEVRAFEMRREVMASGNYSSLSRMGAYLLITEPERSLLPPED